MEKEQQGGPVFVNEKTVFRIALLANIVSWAILVIYVFNFGSNLYQLFSSGQVTMQTLPTTFVDWISFLTSIFYTLAIGLVYFAGLQGVSAGLNLAMDIFYTLQPDQEEDEEETAKTAE